MRKEEVHVYSEWVRNLLATGGLDDRCGILALNTLSVIALYEGDTVSNVLASLTKDIFHEDADYEDSLDAFHQRLFQAISSYYGSMATERKVTLGDLELYMISEDYLSLVAIDDYACSEEIVRKVLKLSGDVEQDGQDEPASFWYSVMALMISEYKNCYNLLLGNALLRILTFHKKRFGNGSQSAYMFLKNQLNPRGYFGYYLKGEFSKEELYSILFIGFDCVVTILEYERENNL